MAFFRELGWTKIGIVALTLVGVFLWVYGPHFNYAYPFHIDEWHHAEQSIKFGDYGEYFIELRSDWSNRFTGLEMGFHVFLFLISLLFDIILIYKFLPAIWAVFGALALFYVSYKKTNSFLKSWLAIIFFASIQSNVNISGLLFFTPLTFAIPFIFLYMYLFSEGMLRKDKKMVLGSLAIMIFLLPTHSISVLFAGPTLLIFALINFRYFFKEYKVFLLFLLIPVIGIVFFKDILQHSWGETIALLPDLLQFKKGWGVLELKNSIFEVYSAIGLGLALFGVIAIFVKHEVKKYLIFLLWPFFSLVFIIIFRISGVSFFSPFQRNLYYFGISLPVLSAIGLGYVIEIFNIQLNKLKMLNSDLEYIKKALTVGIVFITIVFSFASYYKVPEGLELYRAIDENDAKALRYIRLLEPGRVLATPFVSTAVYSLTNGFYPLTTVFFDDDFRHVVEEFFFNSDCDRKNELLEGVTQRIYILSRQELNCGWEELYNNKNYIYQLN